MSRDPWKGTIPEMCHRLNQIADQADLQNKLDGRFEEEEARRNAPVLAHRSKRPKHAIHSASGGSYIAADFKPWDTRKEDSDQ